MNATLKHAKRLLLHNQTAIMNHQPQKRRERTQSLIMFKTRRDVLLTEILHVSGLCTLKCSLHWRMLRFKCSQLPLKRRVSSPNDFLIGMILSTILEVCESL